MRRRPWPGPASPASRSARHPLPLATGERESARYGTRLWLGGPPPSPPPPSPPLLLPPPFCFLFPSTGRRRRRGHGQRQRLQRDHRAAGQTLPLLRMYPAAPVGMAAAGQSAPSGESSRSTPLPCSPQPGEERGQRGGCGRASRALPQAVAGTRRALRAASTHCQNGCRERRGEAESLTGVRGAWRRRRTSEENSGRRSASPAGRGPAVSLLHPPALQVSLLGHRAALGQERVRYGNIQLQRSLPPLTNETALVKCRPGKVDIISGC